MGCELLELILILLAIITAQLRYFFFFFFEGNRANEGVREGFNKG